MHLLGVLAACVDGQYLSSASAHQAVSEVLQISPNDAGVQHDELDQLADFEASVNLHRHVSTAFDSDHRLGRLLCCLSDAMR